MSLDEIVVTRTRDGVVIRVANGEPQSFDLLNGAKAALLVIDAHSLGTKYGKEQAFDNEPTNDGGER